MTEYRAILRLLTTASVRYIDCVDLPTLIRLKRAAGRPKDFEAIAELELLLERKQSSGQA